MASVGRGSGNRPQSLNDGELRKRSLKPELRLHPSTSPVETPMRRLQRLEELLHEENRRQENSPEVASEYGATSDEEDVAVEVDNKGQVDEQVAVLLAAFKEIKERDAYFQRVSTSQFNIYQACVNRVFVEWQPFILSTPC